MNLFPKAARAGVPLVFTLALGVLYIGSFGNFAPIVHAAAGQSKLNLLPGMPAVQDPANLYSATSPGMVSSVISSFPARVYVPNSKSDSVDIIDPATYKIVGHFALPNKRRGKLLEPQHVVPSYDLKTLWVAQDLGDQLTAIDPATATQGKTVHVDDPYNMYFTPDGKYAVVMAERERRLDFRDAHTMDVVNRVPVNCDGVTRCGKLSRPVMSPARRFSRI